MQLGSYTTIDCPTEKIDEAYDFLKSEFASIDGTVRKVYNSHDFGPYPSFEIDYPLDVEQMNDDIDFEEDEEKAKEMDEIVYAWQQKASKIESDYYKRFEEYL
jgi:hypothetical protein